MNASKEKTSDILVFRTSVKFKKDLKSIAAILNANPEIICWNVDMHDSDKVLRIKSTAMQAHDVIRLVSEAGYFCEELPD